MAGAGYKLFNTGDVLTAAQVNTYLMQQTVMVFASSAARTSALSGVLAEGMVSYLQDTNTLEVYDGSAWVGATGDITGLTAGTGITISSATGPVPTITSNVATTFDAKGDLVVGTGADTFAKLTVGNSGETIVADSSASTGLRWQGNFAAGKNKIINGDFSIWQRGTSFTYTAGAFLYTADRFNIWHNGSTAGTNTASQQTFTPGTAPVAGYEGQFFHRITTTTLGTGQTVIDLNQFIEDVRTFAGQTVAVSFWAKSSGTQGVSGFLSQDFGSGGSSRVDNSLSISGNLSSSWQRFSAIVTLPSISGKTIGTGSHLRLILRVASPTAGQTIDVWGVQVEAGNVATAFQTATGTLAGELAACQRYYYRISANASYTYAPMIGGGISTSATVANFYMNLPVAMRIRPVTVAQANLGITDLVNYNLALTAISITNTTETLLQIEATSATGATQYRPAFLRSNNSSTGYLEVSAEL